MAEDVPEGDKVRWSSHGGEAVGEVEEKITKDTEAAGRQVRASQDDPQYLVKSDSGGGEAAHKPDALKKDTLARGSVREGAPLPVSEVSREQEYIGRLYERVDGLRDGASARLALALRQAVGTAQSRLDRDAAVFRRGSRSTQRLGVLHPGPPPAEITALDVRPQAG